MFFRRRRRQLSLAKRQPRLALYKRSDMFLVIPMANQDQQQKLAQQLEQLAKSFQWNYDGRKLDGKISVVAKDNVVALSIEPPYYSKALSTQLLDLLSQALQRAEA